MTTSALTASLARLEEWARHSDIAQRKAEEDRGEMMKRLEEIASIQKVLVDDMQEVKPVTDMVKTVRSKLTGAVVVLGFIGTIVWTAVSFFKESIIKFLSGG